MNLRAELERRLSVALEAAGAPAGRPAMVAQAGRPEFGDYQANGIMTAAKRMKANPRELAQAVLAQADLGDLAESVQIAGPGFLNIRLRADWLAGRVSELLNDKERLGVEQRPPKEPAWTAPKGVLELDRPAVREKVVVDYSGPNLAKEMHVGHLRSTIIGDALARVLDFIGYEVIRQNHVGDWGTQFGMLTAYMEQQTKLVHLDGFPVDVYILRDLEEFYREAKQLFDTDPSFAQKARDYVVRLQSGDQQVSDVWNSFVHKSLIHAQKIYIRLGVLLTLADIRGESEYNEDLPGVVADLKTLGLLSDSQGAKCVFLPEFSGQDGQPLPVIVQKSDGGYLYATTDMAAVRYRVNVLKADRILYVTDSRQALHFQQVFAVARAAGFVPPEVSLEHVAFGTMMGPDRKPFKTRSGDTVKLMDLLDEAEARAYELVSQKSPELPEDQRRAIARTVGIGAVKYADLSQNRASDYVFSWDKMLSLEGNTAPYMQYAYARIASIFRKGEHEAGGTAAAVTIAEPAERLLALRLAQLAEVVSAVAADSTPHVLCGYLYDLAGAFMGFYESCPVLTAPQAVRSSRLRLCELTARTIQEGLRLLGIGVIEQM
jgi:arginyl-tRNA synthetase